MYMYIIYIYIYIYQVHQVHWGQKVQVQVQVRLTRWSSMTYAHFYLSNLQDLPFEMTSSLVSCLVVGATPSSMGEPW